MADSKSSTLYKKYLTKMNMILREKNASDIFTALCNGKNSYMRIDRLNSSNYDMEWITRIEDCIIDLGDIIANPKQVTKTVASIVPIELARKINGESVQHLASHTQYIKDITESGDVIPNKILNIGSEEDIHTYENRFIATLIRRLVLFIEKRFEYVKKYAPIHDEEILYFKNTSTIDGGEVEIETKIKVKSGSSDRVEDVNNPFVARILQIREYVLFFYGSKFMKELKTERDVRNPILMTNILRKNPKYHKCYELYRFIERYDRLGVSYKMNEDASILSEEEINEINKVMFANYLALRAKDKSNVTKGKVRTYKPKILTSIDDEEFIYGKLVEGPIEFVRVDQGYQEYLDSLSAKELPPHPTKIEKEYYKDEYKAKANRKGEKAALDKLEKRKKKQQAEFDKRAREMVLRRERERLEAIEREKEEARLKEEARIEAIRKQLIKDAQDNHEDIANEIPPVENNEPNENVEEVNEVETPTELTEEINESVNEVKDIPEEANEVENAPEEVVETPVEEQPEEEVPEEVVEAPIEEQPVEETNEVNDEISENPNVEESIVEEPQEDVTDEVENAPEEVVETPVDEQPVEEVPEEVVETPIEEQSIEEVNEENVISPIEENAPEEVIDSPVEEPQENTNDVNETPVEDVPNEVEEVVTPTEDTPIEETNEVENVNDSNNVESNEELEVSENSNPIEEVANDVEEDTSNTPKDKKVSKKPVKMSTKKVKTNKKPVEKVVKKPKEKPQPKPVEKIPGRFVVKTNEGYYVGHGKYSVYKHEAKVFDDFVEARKFKKEHGGKVVKL